MLRPDDRGRPLAGPALNVITDGNASRIPATTDLLADLDALAESLSARFAVQVTVDDAGHRRTNVYRSAGAAERAVERARERGRTAHVTLVQMLPVGVVVGLRAAR